MKLRRMKFNPSETSHDKETMEQEEEEEEELALGQRGVVFCL